MSEPNELRVLKTRIGLRRDTAANYEKVKDTLLPLKGEVILVDTSDGLRSKIGDGVKTYAQLPFSDQNLIDLATGIIVQGYFYNGEFYSDSAHSIKIAPFSYKIYINLSDYKIYGYFNDLAAYHRLDEIPNASSTEAGIVKLYSTTGDNTDGTMTQASITTAISKKIDASVDEEEEELIFKTGIN